MSDSRVGKESYTHPISGLGGGLGLDPGKNMESSWPWGKHFGCKTGFFERSRLVTSVEEGSLYSIGSKEWTPSACALRNKRRGLCRECKKKKVPRRRALGGRGNGRNARLKTPVVGGILIIGIGCHGEGLRSNGIWRTCRVKTNLVQRQESKGKLNTGGGFPVYYQKSRATKGFSSRA